MAIFEEKMVMINQYIFGCFAASLLGFVFLYNLRRKVRRRGGSKAAAGKDESVKTSAAAAAVSGGTQRESGGDPDIIIVGAGVAGAALAYTLGKVGREFLTSFYLNCTIPLFHHPDFGMI